MVVTLRIVSYTIKHTLTMTEISGTQRVNELELYATKWIKIKNIKLMERSQTQKKHTLYEST